MAKGNGKPDLDLEHELPPAEDDGNEQERSTAQAPAEPQDELRQLKTERDMLYDRLRASLEELYRGGALGESVPAPHSVFVEGVANLVVNEADKERLKELLRALEEKERIVELLTAYLSVRQEAVRVVIGLEEAMPQMRNLVLIGAPARVGEEVVGSLAVIGPTRMDYQHTITAVSYIAKMFDSILNENH